MSVIAPLPPKTSRPPLQEEPRAVALVCQCYGLTEESIKETISRLAFPSVEAVGRLTGAGTGCTGCQCKIERMVEGKSPSCGRFGLCGGCGCCHAICTCAANAEVACSQTTGFDRAG